MKQFHGYSLLDNGCPKCKQKEDFRITVYTPINKDRNFLSVKELINMKDKVMSFSATNATIIPGTLRR